MEFFTTGAFHRHKVVSLLGAWTAGGSVGNVQNIMGVLYSCTTFLGMFNMMSVMPILGYERSVMYRSVYVVTAQLRND